MTKLSQILLNTALLGSAQKLNFQQQTQTEQSAGADQFDAILNQGIFDIEELQETTPDFCIHPSNWYKDLHPNVNFDCQTNPDGLFSDLTNCTVSCNLDDFKPNIPSISCSCYRRTGRSRGRCRWQPQRRFTTPICTPPVTNKSPLSQRQTRTMQPQLVPYQFDETEMWTPLQATALRQMNMEVPGNRIRKPDPNHRPKLDDGIDPNSNLMRSNFKAVDKWTQLKNTDGVYEVPYKFDYSFTYPDIIKDQIRGHLDFMNGELGQCLKFTERNDNHLFSGRLNIIASGSGCWSYIGRVHWDQDISLGDGCHGRGRTLHEFMHALGFLHEHQRADRDQYIDVHWENIKDSKLSQFTKLEFQVSNNQNYDPYSVMHYGPDAFSKNGQKTITFKNPDTLSGVNGNNGQRLRPTTFDQMAICKMYGCAPTCGKQLSFCDNGEELFFSTRKCDGFNDCSDGSDEWGCPKKCCSSFTFQGQEYKLAGHFDGYEYYQSKTQSKIYFHSLMGFWMVGSELGGDYAFAFAEHQAGVCVADLTTWQVYDFNISMWVLYQNEINCMDDRTIEDEIATTKTTEMPTTTTTDAPGCAKVQLTLGHALGSFECGQYGNNVAIGGACVAVCPTGMIPMCENDGVAICNSDLQWVHKGTQKPFNCKCMEPICDASKFAQKGGHKWNCDYQVGKLVPEGGKCKPECPNINDTPLMKHQITEFTCDVKDGKPTWVPDGSNPINVQKMPVWRKSQVKCRSCAEPKIIPLKMRSSHRNGSIDCTNGTKLGSVCKLLCPEDKVLTCAGPKEQTCLRKGNSMALKWNTNPKCRCVSKAELENAKQVASYNCAIDSIPKYAQLKTSGKMHCFGKRVKSLGQGTKCQINSCPAGKMRITMQCRNGIWRRASKKSQFKNIVNPDLCS